MLNSQVSPPGPVPVSGPVSGPNRLGPNDATPDRGFGGGPTNGTTPDRGFWGGPTTTGPGVPNTGPVPVVSPVHVLPTQPSVHEFTGTFSNR